MKVVIIEDEALTADDISSCITELREKYTVTAILSSIKEAKEYFNAHKDFDLIFSDIHLGDGLSFEIFSAVDLSVPVIFCTAYDNYAINAFKSNGIDYVLKPVNKKDLLTAIEKFERLSSRTQSTNPDMIELLKLFKPSTTEDQNKSILVHHKDKIIPVKLEEIAVFYIRNEITTIVDFKGQTHSINETLEEIELFKHPSFFRANRQFIVNRKVIKDVSQYFVRKLTVNLSISFSEQIIISKEKAPLFLRWLKNS
ncbi:MAG: LytTR family DNA-binding domain-containing protein [Bacteroidetes bacterium]|nr:LytTR family DNA-binding domain-containing protein [Bacteroidota bacterium]